jgi:hypothetical protein
MNGANQDGCGAEAATGRSSWWRQHAILDRGRWHAYALRDMVRNHVIVSSKLLLIPTLL